MDIVLQAILGEYYSFPSLSFAFLCVYNIGDNVDFKCGGGELNCVAWLMIVLAKLYDLSLINGFLG